MTWSKTLPDETPTPDSTATQQPQTQSQAHRDTTASSTSGLHSASSLKKSASLTRSAGTAAEKVKPSTKKSMSYADAGVDITSGDRSKQRIKMLARKTFNRQVLSEIGGFGGLFALDL